jgi:hypothetical protein
MAKPGTIPCKLYSVNRTFATGEHIRGVQLKRGRNSQGFQDGWKKSFTEADLGM